MNKKTKIIGVIVVNVVLGVFILVIIILTIVYLLNGAFLDNCYFTNKSLY